MASDPKTRVTFLKFLSKKNNLFSVRLENGSYYRLHSDFVVKYKIKKNSLIKKSVLNDALNRTEKRLIKNKIIVFFFGQVGVENRVFKRCCVGGKYEKGALFGTWNQ